MQKTLRNIEVGDLFIGGNDRKELFLVSKVRCSAIEGIASLSSDWKSVDRKILRMTWHIEDINFDFWKHIKCKKKNIGNIQN